MRIRPLLALVPVALLLTPPWSGGAAVAGCLGPTIVTDELIAGARIEVDGIRFADLPCEDTGEGGAGGCEDDVEVPSEVLVPTFSDVALRLVQGERSWELGTAGADDDGAITWTVTVSAEVRPGRARLETSYGATRVRVG